MTLSCADLYWCDLISIIAGLNGEELDDERINAMDVFEGSAYLNLNPVLFAGYFQYRVEIFFKVIHGPLGKVKYHILRVAFQICRSPHIHLFSWIIDAPVLCNNNVDNIFN